MGGRGASSGISRGKKYGTEFKSLLKVGNIKFVKYNGAGNEKAPQETMTKGRVYVTVNSENKLKSIVYFDNENKRMKTVDLLKPHKGKLPHTHIGYNHDEGNTRGLNPKEKRMVDFVKKIWYNKKNK